MTSTKKTTTYQINLNNIYFLRRSMPAFLETASRPFFSMVFKALVDNRSMTKRLPASHQTLLYCKLTNCNFLVLWLENDTLFALFAFFPVKGQILPDNEMTSTRQLQRMRELGKCLRW
ncbi:hypothetical protein AtNW77_Chr1g0003921 [Arabidopsis thaliana]|uniref:Uncharacterized protein n=1 Tax=Arabidopsis thaliana TaxID=3702 RepID=A0A1P8AQU8_ARATH|nr:uncharacterized protein AT1G04455 [Arabidopsis thaliana]ANM59033.1 hypothetical protein AT1G04455 [Arabidopsis thaliana]|eukprot:NP_001321428.1 hypothetical protein AT1G04455 [Arabidopsis thaliana]